MKIIEALKELPLIKKKLETNRTNLQQYASKVNVHDSVFGSSDKQREEVVKIAQSSKDLIDRYSELKSRITRTNLEVKVEINGQSKSIQEWITFRKESAGFIRQALQALNEQSAMARMNNFNKEQLQSGVKVELFYDEADKNKRLAELEDTLGKVDGVLEVVNATTDLI